MNDEGQREGERDRKKEEEREKKEEKLSRGGYKTERERLSFATKKEKKR